MNLQPLIDTLAGASCLVRAKGRRNNNFAVLFPLTLPSPPLFPLRGAVERGRKCEVIILGKTPGSAGGLAAFDSSVVRYEVPILYTVLSE